MHFNRHLAFWSRRRGDSLALSCDNETLSWAQLDQHSAALAAHLSENGIKAGDRIGCLLGNSLEWCVAFAASLRMGTIFVPLNAMFGPFELNEIAADAGCAAALSTPILIAKLGIAEPEQQHAAEQPRLYFTNGDKPSQVYAEIISAGRPYTDPVLSDDDVMIICYTSGTTGVPKGVALTHRNVDTAMQGLMLNFGLRPGGDERVLILAPLAFTGGVISNLAVVFTVGGCAWVEKTVDPVRALKRILDHRITLVGGVPALWERIGQAPSFADADLSALRTAYTGGAPVPRALMDSFLAKGVCIRQQYGFTEACGGVSSPSSEGAAANPGSCGQALPAMDLEIRNDEGQRITAPGEVGEIHARGGQLMRGYWNKPEATREAMTADGWYKTGDLARYDEQDGGLLIVDRKKNMLISGGVNIYPAEVERGLRIPSVVECVVLGLDSERWGQEVAAIVYGPTLTDANAVLEQAHIGFGESFGMKPSADRGLVKLPVEERHGFIWIVENPTGSIDVKAHLGIGMDQALSEYGLDQWFFYRSEVFNFPQNWKVMMDGLIDGYHVQFLHGKTISAYFYPNMMGIEILGPHALWGNPRRTMEKILQEQPGDTPLDRYAIIGNLLNPNAVLVMHPHHIEFWTIYQNPADPAACRVHLRYLTPKAEHDERSVEILNKNWKIATDAIINEDVPVGNGIQASSAMPHAGKLVLGRNEVTNQLFHRAYAGYMKES